MNRISRTPITVMPRRRGFTLVELLVSVALVLLLMTLFAQIFGLATESLSTQRGIAENDQRARRLQTTLASDLDRRTYRALPNADGIVPLLVDNLFAPPPNAIESHSGYFYYSENDPNNDTDDVLQFTMQAAGAQIWAVSDAPPYVGKATFLGVADEINQPDADDGGLDWNGTQLVLTAPTNGQGTSNYAEVCYFLRNGNLYRRTSLIREPIAPSATVPTQLQGNYGGPTTFWNDFNFSAIYDNLAGSMRLMSDADLSNQPGPAFSFGAPKFRFGFWGDFSSGSSGAPREFLDGAETQFFGRFTHEETSNANFGYPGIDVTDNSGTNYYMNSLIKDGTVDLTDADNNAVVDGLEGGPRRSEDIVLSNVHSFDIKIFDAGLGEFVDLGHSIAGGDFNRENNGNFGADGAPGVSGTDDDGINGPDDAGEAGWPGSDDYGNRYDTWHHSAAVVGDLQSPYAVAATGPDGAPGVLGVDDDLDGEFDDAGELGWPGSDDVAAMRAIRITIRYRDVSSNQMRDLTIMHSFADRDSN